VKQAAAFKLKIESLITASITGSVDDETARWLANLPDALYKRIAAVGLVGPREGKGGNGLAAFIDNYITSRTDAKPRTIINLKQARTDLVAFFGATRDLRQVTEGDADEFWRYLLRPTEKRKAGLAPNTAKRICGRAKQIFRVAVRKRIIHSNPFADIKSHVQGSSEDREFFITPAMAAKVNDACIRRNPTLVADACVAIHAAFAPFRSPKARVRGPRQPKSPLRGQPAVQC
jgi:Phage integrase SAM-like domain